MQLQIRDMLKSLWSIEKEERLKMVFLGAAFFFIIFSYTLVKELKDSIFMSLVGGKEYVPYAKLLMMVGLVPLVLLYSKLIDNMRRYQVLVAFSLAYALIGLVFAYFMGHPEIGLLNSQAGPSRYLGWFYYFFIESFSPFVLSVFWAFLNSVSNPNAAKKNYGLLISSSKVGGMLSAGLGWWFLYNAELFRMNGYTDARMLQILLVISSVALLMVPLIIIIMMRKVPGQYLHGYEAAYQFEKQQSKAGKEKTGMFSGLMMLLHQPYVFGIFALALFYEIINSVLSFQRLGVAQDVGCGIAGTSCFLLGLSFSVHCVGFFISLFGTRILVSKLGERISLMMLPIVMGTMLFYFLSETTPKVLLICFVVIRAFYYSFNQPVTEYLYIPTVKEVKFKSKSWIDTFGKKMAKGTGSVFNVVASWCGPQFFHVAHAGFFSLVIGIWVFVAYVIGKQYDKAIRKGLVIGSDEVKNGEV